MKRWERYIRMRKDRDKLTDRWLGRLMDGYMDRLGRWT